MTQINNAIITVTITVFYPKFGKNVLANNLKTSLLLLLKKKERKTSGYLAENQRTKFATGRDKYYLFFFTFTDAISYSLVYSEGGYPDLGADLRSWRLMISPVSFFK